jgi:cell volume regulation protein A
MIDLNWMLLSLSGVVLASYMFDLVGRRFKVPGVFMLIASGIGVRIALDLVGWHIQFVDRLLPILGTLGLVLIVLEGALELRLSRQGQAAMVRAALCALLGIALTGGAFASVIHWVFGADWLRSWVLATPFAVISSAVAIPAAASLSNEDKEFVVYESALSDIVGVLLFYALLDAQNDVTGAVMNMVNGVVWSTAIGAFMGLLMAALIGRIEAHVRFVPMIFGLIAVYAGSKLFHLAPLISVLAVGLILNNLDRLSHLPLLRALLPLRLDDDVAAFKHLTIEITFVVRTIFFVLLGYSTALSKLAEPDAWLVAGVMLGGAMVCRWILLKGLVGGALRPLVWMAPRGLITVLLYLNIPADLRIESFPEGGLMLSVLGSITLMTVGVISHQTHHAK